MEWRGLFSPDSSRHPPLIKANVPAAANASPSEVFAVIEEALRARYATPIADSVHAMLPYLGQGAAMAIEDACVLSAAIVRHADDLDEALLAYERVRVPRARAAVLGSRERARENHLASPWARLKRDVKFALRERFGRDKTVFQTAWLYGYDVGRELQ